MYLPGDVLETPKGPFSHIGIYVDTNTVFHNSPGSGECVTSLSEFSNGAGIDLRKKRLTLAISEASSDFVSLSVSLARASSGAVRWQAWRIMGRIIVHTLPPDLILALTTHAPWEY